MMTPDSPERVELGRGFHTPTAVAAAALLGALVAGLAAVVYFAPRPAAPSEQPRVEVKPPPEVHHYRPRPDSPAPTAAAVPDVVASETPSAEPIEETPRPASAAPPIVIAETPLPSPQGSDAPAPVATPFTRSLPHIHPVTSEDELLAALQTQSTEVDLETVKWTGAKLLRTAAKPRRRQDDAAPGPVTAAASPQPVHALLTVASKRADLIGLPFRKATDCQAPDDAAEAMQDASQTLRGLLARAENPRTRREEALSHDDERVAAIIDPLSDPDDAMWKREVVVSTLVQVLQAEARPGRLHLVKMLARNKSARAAAALAGRAAFDPAVEVRMAAVEALRERPGDDFRGVLLDALRHPWAPAAEHAAEALVAVNDRGALPSLTRMLDGPDPGYPARSADGKWTKQELVRVAHLGNCLLCHAPSANQTDPVRGLVPRRGEPLPERIYYDKTDGEFVRADVTYLRQDFSVMQEVKKPGNWPAVQRFDYLLRTRELTPREAAERLRGGPRTDSPQRAAMLFAQRELSCADAVGTAPKSPPTDARPPSP
jgi:hypothetical protein